MVKGERKDHRWAGSSADPTFDVDPTQLDYVWCDAQSYLNLLAFGYLNNEDERLVVEPCQGDPKLRRHGTESFTRARRKLAHGVPGRIADKLNELIAD